MTRGICLFIAGLACAQPDIPQDTSRSGGLPVAALSLAQQVAVYDAATRAAFDVGPSLVLLVHPRRLPTGAGLEGGDPLPAALGDALRNAGVTQGGCNPLTINSGRAPTCTAERSGYVVRATDVFQAGGDTLRLNLRSEVFASATGVGQKPFAFEMAYKLVPDPQGAGRWRAVAEGRVRERE